MAVGSLAIGRSRIPRLEIDELVVRRLHVDEVRVTGSVRTQESSGSAGEPEGPH